MEVGKIIANAGLYTVGVILSLGPSQIYGVVKGSIDLCKLAILRNSLSTLESKGRDLNQTAITKIESDIKDKELSLKADAVALIPVVGAIFSWRVLAPDDKSKTLNALKGVPYAAAHMLNDFKDQLSAILFPLSISSSLRTKVEEDRNRVNYMILEGTLKEAERIKIPVPVRGGDSLEAIALTHPQKEPPPPTVVIFHANAMVGQSMLDIGQYYFNNGFNVLMPTMGGYPGSSP